ncbi:MAG: hypothetical protein KJ970_14090 [Candidatus Eisenbacteria bacterium]|uniref:Cytochrome c domain-containing protein n=1 Tax=Eiseniibacteriota bacterium TaxID=2212470 RepID=A0A948RX07_UNCEI|nr:hypothetical protein [Candidatus Eisenbacteria bacterium]MBU2692046.1 hypothetical protein [Candidatus Eisenbacteria bacterium]
MSRTQHTMPVAVSMLLVLIAGPLAAADVNEGSLSSTPQSSLSYQGHENDTDSDNLIAVYPALLGTRLDDCQTCHTGGIVTDADQKEFYLNPCSYCHLVPTPDASFTVGIPGSFEATLNPFGLDYKNKGRDQKALKDIDGIDSDDDGFTNIDELIQGRYPGDAGSKPGQPFAPTDTLSWEEIHNLDVHNQFMLVNAHRQNFDHYVAYTGVTVKEILSAVGADAAGATSVTFIAPDGHAKDFAIEQIKTAFPAGLYYGNLDPGHFTDPDQGFVTYPPAEFIPEGIEDGGEIPGEQWIMIAYGREGNDLDPGHLDYTSGTLEGEGPYRSVVPQSRPGAPDRSSKHPTTYNDGLDYDDNKEHNSGLCTRGLVAIRINPMPEGYEEFDWKNGGWSLLEHRRILIYGAGITRK